MTFPTLIFGGASIGNKFDNIDSVEALLTSLKALGITRIDTAARYPENNRGSSEKLLGETKAAANGFTIDTKVLFVDPQTASLSRDAVERSVRTSLKSLDVPQMHILYCHTADELTPLKEQAAALDAEYRKGHFTQLGVSNFSDDMLSEFIQICAKNSYVKPSVYQGQYNLLHREIEETLFPILREHGISFVAYSPLAGGFLSRPPSSAPYNGMAMTHAPDPLKQSALLSLFTNLAPHNITPAEAALRWLVHHSKLGEGDGVILGASKLGQVEESVRDIRKGKLEDAVLELCEAFWADVKGTVTKK